MPFYERENELLNIIMQHESVSINELLKMQYISKSTLRRDLIKLEEKEQKYNIEKHAERLDKIIGNWDNILQIINEEVPSSAEIERILDKIGAPKTCGEIGISADIMPMTFKASKDIRDKYVLSRLCWDLGILDEIKY